MQLLKCRRCPRMESTPVSGGAIVSDVDGQIAHDAHSARLRVMPELLPLEEEDELQELLDRDRFS